MRQESGNREDQRRGLKAIPALLVCLLLGAAGGRLRSTGSAVLKGPRDWDALRLQEAGAAPKSGLEESTKPAAVGNAQRTTDLPETADAVSAARVRDGIRFPRRATWLPPSDLPGSMTIMAEAERQMVLDAWRIAAAYAGQPLGNVYYWGTTSHEWGTSCDFIYAPHEELADLCHVAMPQGKVYAAPLQKPWEWQGAKVMGRPLSLEDARRVAEAFVSSELGKQTDRVSFLGTAQKDEDPDVTSFFWEGREGLVLTPSSVRADVDLATGAVLRWMDLRLPVEIPVTPRTNGESAVAAARSFLRKGLAPKEARDIDAAGVIRCSLRVAFADSMPGKGGRPQQLLGWDVALQLPMPEGTQPGEFVGPPCAIALVSADDGCVLYGGPQPAQRRRQPREMKAEWDLEGAPELGPKASTWKGPVDKGTVEKLANYFAREWLPGPSDEIRWITDARGQRSVGLVSYARGGISIGLRIERYLTEIRTVKAQVSAKAGYPAPVLHESDDAGAILAEVSHRILDLSRWGAPVATGPGGVGRPGQDDDLKCPWSKPFNAHRSVFKRQNDVALLAGGRRVPVYYASVPPRQAFAWVAGGHPPTVCVCLDPFR